MDTFEFLEVTFDRGVAVITLQREPLNVLHHPMMTELNTALEGVVSSEDFAAIVIRATGRAFCAGVDVADHTADKVGEMIHRFHGIFRKLASTDALTIAVVHGAALGGGCELACFCDIVLASDRAKFGQPEVAVGVFPPVAASILPAQVGIRKAVEINALGATIDAREAHRIGLVNQVYPSETFEADVARFVERLQKLSRPVVRLSKRATCFAAREQSLAHLDQTEAMYLGALMKLHDAHEGVAAFLEKRAPVWRHA